MNEAKENYVSSVCGECVGEKLARGRGKVR